MTSQALEQGQSLNDAVDSLNVLEGSASTVVEISTRYRNSSTEANTKAADMIRLYQTAAVIYLSRVAECISEEARYMQPLLADAFTLLSQIRTCELQFPLLILGCEARTDEQRITILDLVQRTEMTSYSRDLDCLRRSLRALWVQEDLCADGHLQANYVDRMTSIISATRFVPSLV